MKNIKESFDLGDYYEKDFSSKLEDSNRITDGYFPDYDIITFSGVKFEIKCEDTKWRQTGNHYVEFRNLDKNINSGILLSKSNYWVVALADGYSLQEYIIVRTDDLKRLITAKEYKTAKAKIDVWTEGYLVPLEDLRSIDSSFQIKFKEKQMNTNEIKIGQVAVTGYVGGVWSKDANGFEVKRGATKNGKKYQIFEIKVSSKDKESGEWTNGKGLKVMLWGETPVQDGQEIGIVGRLQPDNWTNQEGKEIRGNMLNAFADDLFEPAKWEPKGDMPTQEVKEDEIPW